MKKELWIVKNEYAVRDSNYSQLEATRNWVTRFYKNPWFLFYVFVGPAAYCISGLYRAYSDNEGALGTNDLMGAIVDALAGFFFIWFLAVTCLLCAEFIWFTFGPSGRKLRKLKASRDVKSDQVRTLTSKLDRLIDQTNRYETALKES